MKKQDADTSYVKNIPVTVDKSHIVVIGEKLYSESIELIRELVNNAYDADATEVRVTIQPDHIAVEDNGAGMDYQGLVQYFNIGSPEKRIRDRSPVFNRMRIGQFGIGKFASLAAAGRFEVITRRGDFAARVIFDKEKWQAVADEWHLPLEILGHREKKGDGTRVVLTDLVRSFETAEVEQRLVSGTPLRVPDFKVYLNGHPVTPRSLKGIRIPVLEGCSLGAVHGEIVIVPTTAADPRDIGIECRVKGVTVRKELFGMETWGKEAVRVRGEINADFLPITSDRTGFIRDSEEYIQFCEVMKRVLGEVQRVLSKASSKKESRRAGMAVKEALRRVHNALAVNPDFSPFGPIPYGDEQPGLGGAAAVGKGEETKLSPEEVTPAGKGGEAKEREPKKKRRRNPLLKRLTPDAVVKKMRFGKVGITCVIDHFGEEGPEAFSEENNIYINGDHPLYGREASSARSFTMYVTRLLSQEIALMQSPRNPRKAFDLQSKILREAFRD